jgi:predicted metalloprotease with PDZ domain
MVYKMLKPFGLILSLLAFQVQAITVNYELSMPEPHTHYFKVKMIITDVSGNFTDVKMPVWAPGSYLVREFGRHVEAFEAKDNLGKVLKSDKINKNTWRLFNAGSKQLELSYAVYANELSVRTSFVNADHGYLNGTNIFMYLDKQKQLPCTLKITPYASWKKISTALDCIDKVNNIYVAKDYDWFVDSPIEIGNQFTFEFEASGCKHEVAMYGEGNYNADTLKRDMKKVVEALTNVVGENPNKRYVFIIHNLTNPSGGLEHLASTTLEVNRNTYAPKSSYLSFLGLVAHEYFHLWNVKRIRPKALGPFDYDNENYTHGLWLSEGVTNYYSDLALVRAGLITPDEFVNRVNTNINQVEDQPGSKMQSAAESSWDAWIKGYRPHENSYNTTISYYSKGQLLGATLDALIIDATNGNKRFDDVLKLLYESYYKKQNRGFTDEELLQAFNTVVGKDMSGFFNDHVFGVKQINYDALFSKIGLNLNLTFPGKGKPYLGANLSESNGKLTIRSVVKGSCAYTDGLNFEDEIIAVDGWRVNNDKLSKYINARKLGEVLTFLVSRDDKLTEIKVKLTDDATEYYQFVLKKSLTDLETSKLKKWIGM